MTREEFIKKYCYEWTERGYEGKPILIEQMKVDLDKLLYLPPAEGAEEIGVYDIANKWAVWVKGNEVAARDSMVTDIYGLLNVHAQKLADKMGEEMLRDEKAFTDWYINHVEIESREEKYIIDNETTIYSFSDLMDYWNRYLKQRQPWMTTA